MTWASLAMAVPAAQEAGLQWHCTWDTGPPAAEVPMAPAPWSTLRT